VEACGWAISSESLTSAIPRMIHAGAGRGEDS
jgi:hypothetical protein